MTAFLVVLSLVPSPLLQANPAGEVVMHGDVQFDRSAGQLRVLQASDRAIIDWESFSIDAGQLTEFVQPNSSSAALNRVRGTSASQIEGMLRANGKVYLLNPNGILIGPNGSIDVGGFAGSTLDVSDEEFRNGGNLNFAGASQAAIVNLGSISALDGDVILIATSVSNEGTIKAPNGTAALAAGNDVLLAESGSERVFVRGASGGNKAVGVNNSGAIEANIAELKSYGGNIYGMAVKNEGRVAATGVTRQGGQIFLSARGGKVRSTGSLKARKSDGSGGSVKVDSGADARTEIGGKIDASGDSGKGGEIVILGREIEVFEGSLILNDGETGGGNTFVGRSLLSDDPEFMNAENVTIGGDARFSANSTSLGGGGTVVILAENTLRFDGIASVAGSAGAAGGFIELSGRREIYIRNLSEQIDLGMSSGIAGTLLIDPIDISVTVGANNDVVAGTTITDGSISHFLTNTGNLTIETTTGAGSGDITFANNANISWSNGSDLTFVAARSIIIGSGASIMSTNGDLLLSANQQTTATTGTFHGINVDGATVGSTGSGNVTLLGKGGSTGSSTGIFIQNGGKVSGGTSGELLVTGKGVSTVSGNGISINGLTSKIDSLGANITLNGEGATQNSRGLFLGSGGSISALGNGDLDITAVGGSTGGSNEGIFLNATGGAVSISTVSGDISIEAQGGGDGTNANNQGIRFNGDGNTISSGGTLTILATGGGTGAGNASNEGLLLTGAGSSITSGGTLQITGVGGAGASEFGIAISSTSEVSTSGDADLTLIADGVSIGSTSTIDSGSGTTTIRQLNNNHFILIGGADVAGAVLGLTDAELDRITAGTLQIGNSNSGPIALSSAISIGSHLSLTSGAGVSGSGDVMLTASKNFSVTANGLIGFSGVITVPGTTSFNSGTFGMTVNNVANNFGGTVSLANSGTNAVQIRDADSLVLGTVSLGGDLTLTTNGNITQSGAITSGGTTTLSAGAANNITLTNALNNFSSVSIVTGNDVALTDLNALTLNFSSVDGTFNVTAAGITVAQFLALGGDTTFESTEGINVSQSINMATDKSFVATASGLIDFSDVNADLSTFGTGEISLTTTRNINLSTDSTIIVEHGDLTLSANAAGTETGAFSGITVGEGALIRSLGTGGISLTGKGGVAPTGNDLRGVEIAGEIRSARGAIEVSGTGGGGTTGERHNGIRLESTGLIESTGTGSGAATITLTGLAGSGSLNEQGIAVLGAISSIDGDISLTGTGGSSVGNNNKGIHLFGSGSITSTGTGANAADISLTGYGNNSQAGDFSDGIGLPGGSITSSDGDITLTGRSYLGNNVGIRTGTTGTTTNIAASGSGAISITAIGSPTATLDDFFSQGLPSTYISTIGSATGTGGITINADTVDLAFLTLANAGELRIRPSGSGVSIGLGGETGTLNLNATELANLANGFSSITIGKNDSGDIRIGASTFRDPLQFIGANNIYVTGQLTGAGNASVAFETESTETTYLNANIVTEGNVVSIIDDVVLGANVLIDTTNGTPSSAGANVSISGTVSGSGSARNLSITSGTLGTILIDSAIGEDGLIGNINLSGGDIDVFDLTSQGNIELIADTLNLGGNVSGSGTLKIAPRTFATIGIGTGATGTLQLDDTEIGRLQEGFSLITIGDYSANDIDVRAVTFEDELSIFGATTININGQLTGKGTGSSITLETAASATTYLNANVVTEGESINIIDSVILGADATLDTTGGGLFSSGANVTINFSVGGSGPSPLDFTITAGSAGAIVIGGSVGYNNLINDITLNGGSADVKAVTSQGNIEFLTDDIILGGVVSGPGTLSIAPRTSGTTIAIGSGADGDLYLNNTKISYLQNGFTSITIGSSTSGNIEIEESAFLDPLQIIGGGNINVIGELTGDANLTFTADNITVDAPVNSTNGLLIFNLNDLGPSAGGIITVNANLNHDGGLEFNGGNGTEDTVTYAGFTGPTLFSLDDLSAIEFLIGSGDAGDELFGPALGSEYTFTGTDSFSVTGVAVSAFENVTAGAGEDTFIFEDGTGLTGTLSGGGPSNQLRFSAFTSAVGIDFENLTASFLGGGFTEINHFVGNGANATFTGQNAATTYTVTGANDFEFGTVPDKVTVTDFANLTGGDGADSFNFKTAGAFTGTLDGGGDSNTIDFATENFGFPASINFETKNGSGFSGGGTFSNIAHFIGQGEGYTFIGQNTAADYTVTGEDDFEFDVYPDTFTVTDFANLTGGTGVDNFAFEDGASLTGSLVGGGTENQLDLSSYASAVAVNFQTGTATGIGGTFSGIDDIVGNGTNATFTGLTLAKTYNISGTNDFTFDSVNVTAFANLTGGSGDDTFIFADAATLGGNLVGGGSANRIDLSAYATAVGVNFQTSTSTGIGGTFSGIDDFDGNGSSSTFTGLTAATTYNVTGANDFTFGSVSVTDFANLTGGTNDDTFIFANAASLGGNLVGGGAANRLDLSAYTGSIGVNFENTTATGIGGTFSGIDDFDGNGANGTFTGLAAATAYSISGANDFSFGLITVTDFANLTGGVNNDTFSFGAGSSLSGTLDGGSGGNTLDYSSYGAAVTVNIGLGTATGLGGFSNVTDFVGSASTDTLRGTTGSDVVNITSNNSGTVNGTNSFASFEILDGGSGNDFFNFLNQATVSLVNGGANFDTLFLDDSNLTGDHTYTITSTSITRNPVYNFINIEHLDLLAGEGDDTINSGFFPFSQSLDSGLGFNTLNLPGVTNLDGTTQIQNVSHLRFAAPRTLQSNPGNGNTPPPPAEFIAQNRFNNGSPDQMMQQLMGNQGGFGATTVIGQGVIIAVEGNSYLIFRAISLDGSGLNPSDAAAAALSANLSVDANVELAGAIGYTGIVLLFMRDGAYCIDLSGAVVDPAVLRLLQANLSTPAAMELFAALELPFLFTIIDADGAVAISFDGNAPGQPVLVLLADQLSDAAFNELNAAIAGGN